MTTDLEELSKKELQDRARSSDLAVSGTKDELVERLRSKREDEAQDGDAFGVTDAMSAATRAVGDAIVSPIESVTGVRKEDQEWVVDVQTVESRRIPPSSDVIATYEVRLAENGELRSFARTGRARRDSLGPT